MTGKEKNTAGITIELENEIKSIISRYPIDRAYIFGSRARGNYKRTSDIYLAIVTKSDLDSTILNLLQNDLEDINIPIYIDLVDFNKINKAALKENIKREGVLIYDRNRKT